MLRKLASIAAAFALAAGAFTATAAAPAPVSAAQYKYPCEDTFTQALLTGRYPQTSSNEQSALAYYLPPNPSHDFGPCGPDLVTNNGVSAWAALVPGSGNPEYQNSFAIVQVGLINCDAFGYAACDGTDVPHIWYALGGCGGAVPSVHDIGAWDFDHNTKYRVSVYIGPPKKVVFYVDGAARHTITLADTPVEYSSVSCWAWDTRDVEIVAEKKDRADYAGPQGVGGAHIGAGVFTGMQREYGGVWYDLTGTTCEQLNTATPHPDGCDAQGTTMWVWTNP